MFAKSQLVAVLFALPLLAFAAPNCNLDALTVTNFTETNVPGEIPQTHISFQVTSPDRGTSPHFSCSGTVIGFATAASGGSCDNGGSYSLSAPRGSLTVHVPWNCPAGVEGTLDASGYLPAGCLIDSAAEHCPPFQLTPE